MQRSTCNTVSSRFWFTRWLYKQAVISFHIILFVGKDKKVILTGLLKFIVAGLRCSTIGGPADEEKLCDCVIPCF